MGKQYELMPYLGKSMLKNKEYQVNWEPEFNYLVDTLPRLLPLSASELWDAKRYSVKKCR